MANSFKFVTNHFRKCLLVASTKHSVYSTKLELLSSSFQLRRVSHIKISCALHPLLSNRVTSSGDTRRIQNGSLNFQRHYYRDAFLHYMAGTRPVLLAQDVLINVQEATQFPWWLTIALVTVTFRSTVTLPLIIYQHYILAKFQNLAPELKKLDEELKQEAAILVKNYNYTESEAKRLFIIGFRQFRTELIIRDNCHPFKGALVVFFQIPVWIALSFALRGFAFRIPENDVAVQSAYWGLQSGGLLWIPDLTVPDPAFILPFLFAALQFAQIELHAMRAMDIDSKLKTITNYFMRGITLILIPVSMSVPSCLPLYWSISCAVGLSQSIVLMFPRFRRAVGIPKTATEVQDPIVDIINKAKSKFQLKKT